MNPVSLVFHIFFIAGSFGAFGRENMYDLRCASIFHAWQCHEENFGSMHTPEYLEALRLGHNRGAVKRVHARAR
jgi:hypothetical protein